MRYSNYYQSYTDYRKEQEMRGQADAVYNNMRFESFVELSKKIRGDKTTKPGVTIRYFGTDLCGDVEVAFGYVSSEVKSEILKLVGETLVPW